MQQPDISPVDGSFVRFDGSVVAAGILQWCGPPVSLPGRQPLADVSGVLFPGV